MTADSLNKKLTQKFFKTFKATLCLDDNNFLSDSSIKFLSNSLFEVLLKHKNSTPNISIITPTKEKDKIDYDCSIINIVNDDVPFLVDSLTAEVNDLGYNINLVINNVIYVKHDNKGNILEIENERRDEYKAISVIQLHIKKIYDESFKLTLKKNILRTLEYVRAAVKDWKSCVKLIDQVKDVIANDKHSASEQKEAIDFINWTKDNNFIFLGFSETYIEKDGTSCNFIAKKSSNLGIQSVSNFDDLNEIPKKIFLRHNRPIIVVSKLVAKSPVHRPVNLDIIRITQFDNDLNPIGEYRFIGLFTSKLFYQYAKDIPIIRKKIEYVIKKANFDPHGHNGKALASILESYPREELFPIKQAELMDICLGIIKLGGLNVVRTFFRKDALSRFISVICFIPRQNFSIGIRGRLQHILSSELNAQITSDSTLISDQPLARVHFIINAKGIDTKKINFNRIEQLIADAAVNWRDQIEKAIFAAFDDKDAIKYFTNYAASFPASYQERFKVSNVVNDINRVEKLLTENTPTVSLSRVSKDSNLYNLKLYTLGTQVTLSNIMPTLSNFGLNVINENTYLIKPLHGEQDAWLNHFKISIDMSADEYNSIKKHFESALLDCWLQKYENDQLNRLLIKASFNIKDISLIRALVKYIIQTNFSFSIEYIENTLIEYPDIVRDIKNLFYEKFDPSIKKRNIDKVKAAIEKRLHNITNISHDLIFKKLVEIIDNMVRTNYFQTHKKDYISFKIASKNLTDILLPKPFAEIFVYSSDTEGIHLRGGKVARGGIRWSDRTADYRTEVHGLVKAQMTKNAIIVPVGSKGGFIVKKDVSGLSRDEFYQAGIASYTTFLCGLLDITDNIIEGKVVQPGNMICYDDHDPYLVVAADKGTATFSDTANSISAKYNFWLGDAFASGGSNGYDHKKMGITAKGAWESVKRHFFEFDLNVSKDPFTVIGIGDMSGDVFGNGMLLSKQIKLVAAFNHMHIFVDPDPNPAESFKERQRLFNLPRSGWNDYNTELLSKGGAIYSRSQKSITLSKEVMTLLNLKESSITPDKLIKAILCAKVDLLWNGGIGTYIKSSLESNSDVGDKNNDAVRVDAAQLNCRIIGEGGNLGLTQKGRIEYAQKGGRLNTDSIDNSGGVNCSDHEVNIKIALQHLMQNNLITKKSRDKLLENMTDEVAKAVLHDSFLSAQAVSLAESHNYNAIDHQERLMKKLEDSELLDRKVEFLPTTEEVIRRKSEGNGLTRPELCVLLSYSKIYLYNDLVNSGLPDEEYYLNELIKYFPEQLVKKFKSDIFNHPLKREIICTFVANSMVNRLGITFFNRLSDDTGIKICDIARAYTIIKDSFKLPTLWKDIENLQYHISAKVQIKMFREISKFLERATSWLLRTYRHKLDTIENYVAIYYDKIDLVLNNLEKVLSDEALATFKEKYQDLRSNNVPTDIARKIAALDLLPSIYQIIYVSQGSNAGLLPIAKIYFSIGITMHIRYLEVRSSVLTPDTYWEKLSIKSYNNNLLDQQMRITNGIVSSIKQETTIEESNKVVSLWLEQNAKQINRYYDLITDIQAHDFPDFSMLNVAGHRLEEISSTLIPNPSSV